MASEDSDEVMTGLLVIHRFGNASDLDKTLPRQVPPRLDHIHARRKASEVEPLRGTKRMLAKERDNRPHEITALRHGVLAQVLLVVVMSSVHVQPPYSEELLKLLQA